MPFTLFHGIIGYLSAIPFTKDPKIRFLAFAAGILPDLDGLPVLYNNELYHQIHHAWFHPPIYGIFFGLLFVTLAFLYYKKYNLPFQYLKTFGIFFLAFSLHPLTDIISSNWAINIFYPFGTLYLSTTILGIPNPGIGFLWDYSLNQLLISLTAVLVFAVYWIRRKPQLI